MSQPAVVIRLPSCTNSRLGNSSTSLQTSSAKLACRHSPVDRSWTLGFTDRNSHRKVGQRCSQPDAETVSIITPAAAPYAPEPVQHFLESMHACTSIHQPQSLAQCRNMRKHLCSGRSQPPACRSRCPPSHDLDRVDRTRQPDDDPCHIVSGPTSGWQIRNCVFKCGRTTTAKQLRSVDGHTQHRQQTAWRLTVFARFGAEEMIWQDRTYSSPNTDFKAVREDSANVCVVTFDPDASWL